MNISEQTITLQAQKKARNMAGNLAIRGLEGFRG